MTNKNVKLTRGARKLLNLVPLDGTFIGNKKLQRRSRVGKGYWKFQKELVSKGIFTRGKGRGGSVARLAVESEVGLASKKGKSAVRKESELYEPLKSWLATEWGEGVEGGDFFDVLITGTPRKKGRKSGKWSRPDVTLVQVNSYDYLPQPVLDVTTFEVKKFPDAEDLRSVYETASHSRRTHFSYLVAEVPDSDYEFPERFVSELERFHLGLIFMWKNKGKWEFEEQEWETERLNPEPEELNRLLKEFFQACPRAKEFKQALGKG
jgi:hypothetical protein